MEKKKYKIASLAKAHSLTPLYLPADYEKRALTTYNVTRPALQLTGFYDYFDEKRLQIFGKAETAFLRALEEEERKEVIDRLFSSGIPALVVCNRAVPDSLLVDAARRYDVCLFTTDMETSDFIAQVINTLRTHLAPTTTVHAVLVQVHGEGVLITGESGIGKSEVALELIKRGHRLVADDAVELRRLGRESLEGTAPKFIRYLMELRGVGIIDVRRLYGVGAVLPRAKIDLVVNFVHWDDSVEYDRLGAVDETTSYLGVTLPQITVPVAPARNLAIILEVAAMNNRDKRLGHNTAKEFLEMHDRRIDSGWDEDLDD